MVLDDGPRSIRGGFTLVELLVVIAILALLVGLLLPAVHSVRESARVSHCKNNLRQIAMGGLQHLEAMGAFPLSGGTYNDTGDADQGLGSSQRGGWLYSLLPFIEQDSLFQLGAGLTGAARTSARAKRIGTVVSMYICPTRGASVMQLPSGSTWNGATTMVRSDYAGSKNLLSSPQERQITDGFGSVFYAGERYINPDEYHTRTYNANNQGWTVGTDMDTISRTSADGRPNFWNPTQDTPGLSNSITGGWPSTSVGIAFGSPHDLFPMAMCDGSVRSFGFGIDLTIYSKLGGVSDGGALDEVQ